MKHANDDQRPFSPGEGNADDVRDAVADFFGQELAGSLSDATDVTESLDSLEQLVDSIDASRTDSDRGIRRADHLKRTSGPVGQIDRHIAFDLGGTRYAVAMENVLEVERLPAVTAIPNVPEWVEGLSNLRGEIISVVDLRRFFDLDENESDGARRMLVVKSLESDLTTSLVVDRVAGIRNIAVSAVKPPTSSVNSAGAEFLKGTAEVENELLVILDLEALLQCEQMQQFNAVAV